MAEFQKTWRSWSRRPWTALAITAALVALGLGRASTAIRPELGTAIPRLSSERADSSRVPDHPAPLPSWLDRDGHGPSDAALRSEDLRVRGAVSRSLEPVVGLDCDLSSRQRPAGLRRLAGLFAKRPPGGRHALHLLLCVWLR